MYYRKKRTYPELIGLECVADISSSTFSDTPVPGLLEY